MENPKNLKVWVAELLDPRAIATLEAFCQVDIKYKLSREDQLAIAPDYHAVLIRSETNIDKEFLDAATNLRIVGRAGSGLDNVDIPYATQKGVIVANTPESNIVSACEQTWALMLSSSRNTAWAWNFIRSGEWDRKRFEGSEVYSKTLGIIGLGRIGSLVSVRAKGFGMRVIAYDPYILDSRFESFGVEKKATLEELVGPFQVADLFSTQGLHQPILKRAVAAIDMMKDGVRLVNCARGGLYNEDALYRGLKSGKIASLGMDVWITEPQHAHPFYEFDNVVGTPHLGASTYEATARVGTEVVAEVISGLKGEIVKNAVNIPSVSEQSFAKLKAWIRLVEKMGSLYAQIRKESVRTVEIEFAGKEVDDREDVKVLSLVALKGLLDQSVPETVNFVNASLIAEQRGIDIRESISLDSHDYSNLVKMKVTEGSGQTFEIHGTVFDKIYPRIVRIGDYKMELIPEGRMVWSPHKNVPGVIGKVGTTMAEYNVNILRMVVSDGPQDSMMILTVENNVPQEALDKVREFGTISDVKMIDL